MGGDTFCLNAAIYNIRHVTSHWSSLRGGLLFRFVLTIRSFVCALPHMFEHFWTLYEA